MGILGEEGTDQRLSYWAEVWKELCHSIQKGDICIKLLNPHMLILDILEEYELNKLKNKQNRIFFIRTIEILLKENLIVKQFFTKEYIVLKDKLENKDYSCIYSLCQQINDLLSDRKYAYLVFKMLKGILMRPAKADDSVFKENLKELRKYTKRPAILDNIDSACRFYNDNAYALDLLSDEERKVKEEILYIYKYRNQVVLNGYDNKSILPHIVNAAQKHAKNLLLLFIASFSLYKFDVGQTIKKINKEKEQLFSGLEEENYFEVKFELFTDTNLFF